MLAPARYLADFARFAARKGAQEQHDAQALAELERRPLPVPRGLQFTPSAHWKLLLGLAVPFDGQLTCDHLDALSPAAYRCGDIYGIETTTIVPTHYDDFFRPLAGPMGFTPLPEGRGR